MKKLMAMMFVLGMLSAIGMQAKAELLVYYDFDEASGTTVGDSSGNGHTGTFTVGSGGYSPPVIWSTTDKPSLSVGNASSGRLTDNVNTLTTPDACDLDGLKSFTLMMWVNGNPSNSSGYPMMAWKLDRPGGDFAGFAAWWDADGTGALHLTVGGESSNTIHDVTSDAVSSLSGWHHWAVTYDGTNMATDDTHFYLDGSLIGSCSIHQSTVLGNALDLYVLSRGDVANRAQRQLSDEFRVYGSATDSSGALSQEAIRQARSGVQGLTYYGFLNAGADKDTIQIYQQARVNSLVMSVGPHNPEVYKVMRKAGQAGIGVIAEWSYIFWNYPSGQWATEIANVKNVLDAQDVTKYIVLNDVIDEPEVTSSVTNTMVAAIESAFPDIPSYINWGSDFDTSGRVSGTTVDVVGFDYYLWPNESEQTDVAYFNSRIDPKISSMKSLAPGKLIVLTGQSSPYPDDYQPTAAQMRMYADKAIADSNINGLLYWDWGIGGFNQTEIGMFKAVGADAGLPLCSKRLLFGQDYEGTYDWDLILNPWTSGESLTYYLGSGSGAFYCGDYSWQVDFSDISSSIDRRAYNLMDEIATQDKDFSLVIHTRSFSHGNSGDDIGYIGLFQSNSSFTHNPFVGVNLGSKAPNKLSLMLQVRIGNDVYQSESLDCVVDDNTYYEVIVDYMATDRTFDYTVVDPDGTVVLTDFYTLSTGANFSLDAFGVSDVPDIADSRSISMGIDDVTVNIRP